MIFLDYSDCGPEGEPCVVHIDQEGDYEITCLADDFASFETIIFRGFSKDDGSWMENIFEKCVIEITNK
jgi:hypothetical protein